MTGTPEEAVSELLSSGTDVIQLGTWLLVYLQASAGMSELQANDELDDIQRRVVRLIDARLTRDAGNRILSPYEWVDSSKSALIRTGLDRDREYADTLAQIIRWREDILEGMFALTGRQFEHLCDMLLNVYGIPREKRKITQASNEGGIDFIAVHSPSTRRALSRLQDLQFRVVGQATRVRGTVGPDKMDAFCQRVNDCRRDHGRAWEMLPEWFKTGPGPIIGLFVTTGTLGPAARRSVRENVVFAIEGNQVAEDLASTDGAKGWFQNGTFLHDHFVADFPTV